jgi:uncharacterized protein YecE (DUF72 family)
VAVIIGTSGWQYKDWRGRFYPQGLPQSRWLEHYARRFCAVEVNNTFYRLPGPGTFTDWADRTPDGFVWVVKASRYLSHVKRLQDPAEPVQRLLDHAEGLRARMGPVLLQLPPTMKAEPGRLDETLSCFADRDVKVCVEPRHETWFTDATFDLLRRHDAALCLTDRLNRRGPLVRTANWGYLRFHEGTASPWPRYGRAALDAWAERLADLLPGQDTYVFFNNDPGCWAVENARQFALACRRQGLEPTRVPEAGEVDPTTA